MAACGSGVFAADEPPKADDKGAELSPDDGWQRSQLPKGAFDPKVLSDRQPLQEALQNPEEYAAFFRVLAYAKSVPQELLARHARPGISYDSLADDEQRRNFFGHLIQVTGKLARPIQELRLPDPVSEKLKSEFYYSAWLKVEGAGNREVLVLFTDLPSGLAVGEQGEYKIQANGYLFKLMRYSVTRDRDGNLVNEDRFAPLLVARTLVVLEETPPIVVDESDEAKVRLNRDSKEWEAVKDERPLASSDNEEEYRAYNLVVKHARGISPEGLRKYAKKDVVYADLISDLRKQFLREPLHVEGTLRRLREREATGRLMATTDIKKIYEGWIQADGNLYTVVFTELPEGLKPGEQYTNKKVAFDGYYFKLHAYETKDENKKSVWYRAPLLIGRTIEVLDPDPSYFDLANPVIPFILGLLALVAVIVLGLLVWYRYNDRKVKAKAIEAMTRHNPFEGNQGTPPRIEPGSDWERLEDG